MQELTPTEKRVYDAYCRHRSGARAIRELGISERNFYRYIQRAKLKGWPHPKEEVTENTPLGYTTGKVTLHEKINPATGEFEVMERWPRVSPSADAIEQFHTSLAAREFGRFPKIKRPKATTSDHSLWLPIGDPHFGMHAWGKEAGEDYNLDIARDLHITACCQMIDRYPNVAMIGILPLGDLVHSDSRLNRTEKSGHVLDVDSRFWKVIDVTTDALCTVIEYAASRARKVYLSIPPGNHDWHTSGHIARTLAAAYDKTSHIEVDTRVTKQRVYRWHRNLLFWAHGDTEKMEKLPGVLAHDHRQAWGETDHHYIWTGHVHTKRVFDAPGARVESFCTLAAKDAYTAEHGYRSERSLTGILLHKERGEVERGTIQAANSAVMKSTPRTARETKL